MASSGQISAARFTRAATPRSRLWAPIAVFGAALLLQLVMMFAGGSDIGVAILLAGVGTAVVLAGLAHPAVAVSLLLITTFLRLALPISALPVDAFVLAFGGVISSAVLAVLRRVSQLPRLGAAETAMLLYLAWNMGSAIAPHALPATVPLTAEDFPVWRFILSGTMIPFALYYTGRFVLTTDRAVRRVLWLVLGLAGYSAWVSIMQFHGPAALVWPRYIVDDPLWDHRAVGVFNQPAVNGLLLIIGFMIALYLASRAAGSRWPALVPYYVLAASSAYAIYLTHTRVIWLAFLVILIAGAVLAHGWRTGFIISLVGAALLVMANWSTFLSADREAGGVASTAEIDDRLNIIATSLWAIQEKPIAGWGIGRFTHVNTYYHQQWSPEIDWKRGHGLSSHLNELGIAAELGVVGVAFWLAVLVLVGRRLVRAVRLAPHGTAASGVALVALFAFAVWVTAGTTVDLRFFEFPNALVMLLAGIATAPAQAAAGLRDRHSHTGTATPAQPHRHIHTDTSTGSNPLNKIDFARSNLLQARLHELVPGGAHTFAKGSDQYPEGMAPVLTRGHGARVWDVDGNEFVEYGMGMRAVTLGHGYRPVIDAVCAALADGLSFTRPTQLELAAAEDFLALVPGADMVKFAKNASDATSTALRLARAATGRELVVLCHDQPYFSSQDWFVGTLPISAGVPDSVRALTRSFSYNDLESLRRTLQDNQGEVACVILEPATSLAEPAPGFLSGVRELCDQHGVVLIFDETITGFRWSAGGAQSVYGVTPDLSTWGKAMGNGFPIAALAGRRELMELGGLATSKPRVFLLSSTHGAETASLAAFRAVARAYAETDPIATMERQGAALAAGINAAAAEMGIADYLSVIGRPSCLVFRTADANGVPSQAMRTLFLQEILTRGVLGQSYVISAAHTGADVAQTIGAARIAMIAYRKALETGRPEELFSGRPVAPAHREFSHPRELHRSAAGVG